MGSKSIAQGAATGTFLATHPSVKQISGEYFTNFAVGRPSAHAQSDVLANQLWEISEDIVSRF